MYTASLCNLYITCQVYSLDNQLLLGIDSWEMKPTWRSLLRTLFFSEVSFHVHMRSSKKMSATSKTICAIDFEHHLNDKTLGHWNSIYSLEWNASSKTLQLAGTAGAFLPMSFFSVLRFKMHYANISILIPPFFMSFHHSGTTYNVFWWCIWILYFGLVFCYLI